jgi:hypothetical protein
MRSLITAVLLMGGAVNAQAPSMLIDPVCEAGQIVGLRIGALQDIPAGAIGMIRWAPDVCKGAKDA